MDVRYRLTFPDGSDARIDVAVDDATLDLRAPLPAGDPPEWTRLKNRQCPNCPLDPEVVSHCPLAVALAPLVDIARDVASFATTVAEVTTPERTIRVETTMQRAIASLMGLVIATSGCPHTRLFRPMARFHLPFASEEETIYRATSMYLLAQYFTARDGDTPDLAMAGLRAAYREIHTVNTHIARRLKEVIELDASVNALIILDLFSKALPDTIEDQLEEIRYLFEPYLATAG